jgi:hypothetical protein
VLVHSTARHAIHSQFDISANTVEIRAVQSPKRMSHVMLTVKRLELSCKSVYTISHDRSFIGDIFLFSMPL